MSGTTKGLNRQQMADRIAFEFQDGWIVNLGVGTLKKFKTEMPGRFLMEGVSEANLIGMSGAAASVKVADVLRSLPHVAVAAPFVAQTDGMLGAAEFEALKPDHQTDACAIHSRELSAELTVIDRRRRAG